MKVQEQDGPRGGEYFFVDLSDGRRMVVSRKQNDNRVWLGKPDDPKSWNQQRGGVGTIPKLFDEWGPRIELDSEAAELYRALSALQSRKKDGLILNAGEKAQVIVNKAERDLLKKLLDKIDKAPRV